MHLIDQICLGHPNIFVTLGFEDFHRQFGSVLTGNSRIFDTPGTPFKDYDNLSNKLDRFDVQAEKNDLDFLWLSQLKLVAEIETWRDRFAPERWGMSANWEESELDSVLSMIPSNFRDDSRFRDSRTLMESERCQRRGRPWASGRHKLHLKKMILYS